MKVYMFYLSLPEDLSEYDECEVADWTMISPSFSRYMEYDPDTKRYVSLYAITDDKHLADEFEFMHDMNLFVRIKRKVSSEDYEELIKEFKPFKLYSVNLKFKYPRSYDIGVDHILLTELEDSVLNDDEFGIEQSLCEYSNVDYSVFKKKYVRALDFLLYCTYNKIMYCEDMDSDYYASNFSYGITAEGFPNYQVNLNTNIFKLYARFFALLLRKEK